MTIYDSFITIYVIEYDSFMIHSWPSMISYTSSSTVSYLKTLQMMRYVYTLENINKPQTTLSTPSTDTHVYNKPLRDRALKIREMCDTDEMFANNYRRVVIILHPFELIRTEIKCPLIPNSPPLKITNAFMKMWEFLKYMEE